MGLGRPKYAFLAGRFPRYLGQRRDPAPGAPRSRAATPPPVRICSDTQAGIPWPPHISRPSALDASCPMRCLKRPVPPLFNSTSPRWYGNAARRPRRWCWRHLGNPYMLPSRYHRERAFEDRRMLWSAVLCPHKPRETQRKCAPRLTFWVSSRQSGGMSSGETAAGGHQFHRIP